MRNNALAIPTESDWDVTEWKVSYSEGKIADDLKVGEFVKIEKTAKGDFKVQLDSAGSQPIIEFYDYYPNGMLVHSEEQGPPEGRWTFYCVIFQVPGTNPPVVASSRWKIGNTLPGGTGVWGAGGGG